MPDPWTPDRAVAPPSRIETRRLILRCWSLDDAPALADALEASRSELARWTPWVLEGSESLDGLRERLARSADDFATGAEWRYAIAHRDDPSVVIGGCGLYPRVGPGALELGYWLATSATSRGYATEAAAALDAAAFALPDVTRVEIRCDPENDASMRVPQRLGYVTRPEVVHEQPTPGRPGGDVVVWERQLSR